MALVRLTHDMCQQLAKKMSVYPQKVRDAIVAGTIEGQKMTDRIYQIEESEIQRIMGETPVTVETTETVKVPMMPTNTPVSGELSETQKSIRDTRDKIELAKQETELTKVQIALDEIKGKRAKPEYLEKKERELNDLAVTLHEKENALLQREQVLKAAEDAAYKFKLETSTECGKLTMDTQNTCRKVKQETETYLAQKKAELEVIEKSLAEKQALVTKLDERIKEYPNLIQPYLERIQRMVKTTETYANRNYAYSEKTKGATSDYYTRRANYAWSLSDGLTRIVKWLGG